MPYYKKVIRHACLISSVVFVQMGFSQYALACEAPKKPVLPDINTTVVAEMIKTQKEVKKYMALGKAFLDCSNNTKNSNDMVDNMAEVGNGFNALIKEFKARNKK